MGIRKQQKEKSEKMILKAALNLFFQKGFRATKITEIAEQSGVSVGLIFHYFESKEKMFELLVGLTTELYQEVEQTLEKSVEPIPTFQKISAQVLNLITDKPFSAKLFLLVELASHNADSDEIIKNILPKTQINLQTIAQIKLGQKQGKIRDGNPYILMRLFWNSFVVFAEEVAENENVKPPAVDWIMYLLEK